jgi:hypothetical protein
VLSISQFDPTETWRASVGYCLAGIPKNANIHAGSCASRNSSIRFNERGVMKKYSVTVAVALLGLGALVLSPTANVRAAELQVLAGGAMTAPLRELGA